MNSSDSCSNQTHPLWMDNPLPSFPPLKDDLETDVCIVGAGIAGLTCAYMLAKQGKSVAILEQDLQTGGQTPRTTGHLTCVLDDRFFNLEKFFGEEGARAAIESHNQAINTIEKIVSDEKIECDFERLYGYLFVPPDESITVLVKEATAIQKTGMRVDRLDRTPFSASFDAGPCLRFPNQAQFHVMKYLRGVISAILKYGGKIFSGTHVSHCHDGKPCLVETANGFKVTCQSIIVATCSPINNRFFIHTKQAPYRTYVIAGLVPKGSVPKGLYWDTGHPYHYIRIQRHLSDDRFDWLLVGGEDHKTGQDPEVNAKYDRLEDWARERFPMLGKIDYRWSGQVFEPVDSLAFIGRNPHNENIYIATGDSGNGITHSTIAGILLPDLILGKNNPWKTLYEPSRKTLSAAPKFLEENSNVFWQYGDWLTPGEKKEIAALALNEGIILRKGVKKIAVYKDARGKVHINSAFCTHLGGCVRWNEGEKSWDCPCHGSRFNGCGKVITGPANSDLTPYQNE